MTDVSAALAEILDPSIARHPVDVTAFPSPNALEGQG